MPTSELRRFVLDALRETGSVSKVADRRGLSEEELNARVRSYLREKATSGPNRISTGVIDTVRIDRDQRGVPHITASNNRDLAFAAGFAQAQDRLWQLDFLRRQAYGTLSEVFGASKLESDILSRTIGVRQVADANFASASPDVQETLSAFSDGVNAWMAVQPAGWPVEFELLGYTPREWQPVDSLAIFRRWLWYLTGRLNVITTPEAIRAGIGDGELYSHYLQPDAEPVTIVKEGEYKSAVAWPDNPAAELATPHWGFAEHAGSNNWVAGPSMTGNGSPLLASDPHVYDTVPAEWYEMRLIAPGIDTAGCGYPAMPFVMFGRNRHVAWGITNNICSMRDLYIETLEPGNPNRYRTGDDWTELSTVTETIQVRDGNDYHHTTRFANNRPVVDHLLPAGSHPAELLKEPNTVVSLAWVGFEETGEPEALFALNRSDSVPEAREALSLWRCPTFNMVLADDSGEIGYQAVGAIPLRGRDYRGYRRPDRADDAWLGYIPFEKLPRVERSRRDWVVSANNPTAPADYPYPLAGTWAPEDRAFRAESLMQTTGPHTLDTFASMQTDVHSGRAERGAPGLVAAIRDGESASEREAISALLAWDHRMTVDSAAAAIFYVFFWRWHQQVVQERFPATLHNLVQDAGWGLSSALLHENDASWFSSDEVRVAAIKQSFNEALLWLTDRFGADQATWRWGDLHTLGASHPAAQSPLQHAVFDIPPQPHSGGVSTVASAFYTPVGTFESRLGANFRLLTSLAPDAETRAICWPGQSGQPGSVHYCDQVADHLAGRYLPFPFAAGGLQEPTSTQTLVPGE